MKIKKITTSSLQEAVEEIKALYGSDAVILSTRVVKIKRIPFLPLFKRSVLEVTVGIPDKEDFSSELKKEESIYEELSKMKDTLKEVVDMVRRQRGEIAQEDRKEDIEGDYSIRAINLINKLIKKGVSRDIAKKLVESACGYDYELRKLDLKGESLESLVEGFKSNIKLIEDFLTRDKPFRIITLVGPTGVGKTTTIAKLAYALKAIGKKVGVITIDSFRVGAVEQLKSFVSLMEVPFRTADTPYKLRECVGELSSMDVLLVDTAGRSQYNEIRVKELLPFFNKLPSNEVYLTIGANMDEKVMYDSLNSFSILSLEGLIFTKLDETDYHGYMINVSYRTQVPLACFTVGQRVPEDIAMASYEYVAKLFL